MSDLAQTKLRIRRRRKFLQPAAMEALMRFNTGYTSGYGSDQITAMAADKVRELLDADAEVRFMVTGTAANALALSALCQPFEAVLCHEHAHIVTDEAGAPGFFGHGLGLIGLPGQSASQAGQHQDNGERREKRLASSTHGYIKKSSVEAGKGAIVGPHQLGQVHLQSTQNPCQQAHQYRRSHDVALRVARLFRQCGDAVEANVG